MKLENALQYARFLEVDAVPRYMEDGSVNGVPDSDELMDEQTINMPFFGDEKPPHWKPVIDLDKGLVVDWPADTIASLHYKVADDGEYWLLSADRKRIAKWKSHYVPNDFLCHGPGANGFGDYIILEIDVTGQIVHWEAPIINADEWEAVEDDGA